MASNERTRRRQRRHQAWTEPSTVGDDDIIETARTTTCIDLTTNTTAEDIIDLTQSHGIMDSPVVVLTPSDDIGPMRHRRGSGRLGRRHSRFRGVRRARMSSQDFAYSLSSPTSTSSGFEPQIPHLAVDDSDNDDLPDVPFHISEQAAAENSLLKSPEPVKVMCPVCMDDIKQIKRSKRQVMSTICGHIFCDSCIREAINVQRSCPSCRKKLTQRNIHPLFL